MIIKKKVDDGKYEVVKDIVTFETPNKNLLEKVASESSKVYTSGMHSHRNGPENSETHQLAKISFELEVKGR
jgi:hypothetical protein